MRLTFLCIFIAISLGSCAKLSQNSVSPAPPSDLATKTGSTVTPIIPSNIATATSTVATFPIENFNSPNRLVELSELDLRSTTRLLIFDPRSEQILSISGSSINPILNIQSRSNIPRDGIEMSPDHRWFAYLEINDGFNIWISSVDNTQHFVGINNAVGSSFRWLNNEKISVYNKLGFWLDCPSEMQIFDLYSREVNSVPDISTQGSQYCFPIPYFNPDLSQALYLNSDTGWEVYDYKTQTSYSALPGLDASPGGDKSYFNWGINGLSFAIPDSNKITFVQNLPESSLTLKPPLATILLPRNTLNENKIFEFWIPNRQLAGFDLVGEGKNSVLDCGVSTTFVMVNLSTRELMNYCLDRSVFFNQIGIPSFAYISADYRFVGWTIRKLPNNVEPLGIAILDTETGKISYLEGYEFLGFGEVSP